MAPGEHRHSREAVESNQLDQLRALLTEIFPANRFYAQKLNNLGITFDVASLQDFSRRFPFTTKAELVNDQEANPPYGTNLTYPLHQYTRYHQTSGTTARPLRWLDTEESWNGMVESWMEIFQTAGVRAGDRVYFAFSFGPFIGFWLAFESAARLGCLCLPGGGLSSAGRLQAMMDNEVSVLCCTPTYALRLAEVAAIERFDLRRLKVRKVFVAGEPGGSIPAVRERITDVWNGAQLFDHHGMTETGPVTYQCPDRVGVLHVIEAAYYPEVIDPNTEAKVNPGEPGELVLTTLNRFGMPLLRYRTGDLVRVSASCGRSGACKCGRYELALEGGIIGRTDDMVVVRGVNVYPSAVDQIIRSCPGIAEYQVEIVRSQALPQMILSIEAAADCPDHKALVHGVEKAFQSVLALTVPVNVVSGGTLPRFEMKARRWLVR